MAEYTKFRSSLSGFHRGDVVAYIESLCAEHQAALQKLQEENRDLQQQLEQTQSDLDRETLRVTELQQQLDETQTALESTETALDEAMVMLTEEQAKEEEAVIEANYKAMELEAYRRAEAMERAATERAARTGQQLSDLLDQVSGRYEQTGQEIQVLAEDIRINLKRLEESLSDLDAIFEETTQSFDTMDPAAPLVLE